MDEKSRKTYILLGIAAFLLHFSQSEGNPKLKWPWDDKLKVQIKNDGPTTIGGRTTFVATLSRKTGQKFQFCWFTGNYKKQKCNFAKYNDTFVKSDWASVGVKSVKVVVKNWPSAEDEIQGSSQVLVTDTINAKLVAFPNGPGSSFQVGPVNLSVEVHDPSDMFPGGIMYEWDFDDGTSASGKVHYKQTHNFTEDRTYKVRVLLYGMTIKRIYNGSVSKDLDIKVSFNMDVKLTGREGTFTTLTDTLLYISSGEVMLELLFNNPYSIVQNISADWSFGDGSSVTKCRNRTVTHVYITEDYNNLWVTPRLITKHKEHDLQAFTKTLYILDPITEVNLMHIPETNITRSMFNVNCDGSPPFKMCWNFIKAVDFNKRTTLPVNCTWSEKRCDFRFNDTRQRGQSGYVNVTVSSYVSKRNVLSDIPALAPTIIPSKPTQSAETIAVETVVSLFLGSLALVIAIIYIARRIYRSRKFAVLETADFDFRDEDCKSVDSLQMEDKRRTWFLRGCKEREAIPLLSHCAGNNRTSLYNNNNNNNNNNNIIRA